VETVLLTTGLFGSFMLAMAIGVIVSNRALRGSCGGPEVHDAEGHALSCGACPKKENEVCPSDDEFVRLAQIAHPNPSHHR